MQNATPSPFGEIDGSFPSVQGNLRISAAPRRIRRIFGPFCTGKRVHRDVSEATDVDVNSNDEGDFAAWTAYRKAKKENGQKVDDGGAKKGKDKVEGGGG